MEGQRLKSRGPLGAAAMATRIHPTADVSPDAAVGDGTQIWHWVQVRDGARIGRDCILGKDVYIDADVVLGDRCKVENFATIYRGVTLGDRVFVGPHACFTNDLYPRADSTDWEVVPTRVEDGASIGANATILCGVTIGQRAMVAAGAVVTRDVPAHALVAGVPAKVVGWVCDRGHPLDSRDRCARCNRTFDVPRPRVRARSRRARRSRR